MSRFNAAATEKKTVKRDSYSSNHCLKTILELWLLHPPHTAILLHKLPEGGGGSVSAAVTGVTKVSFSNELSSRTLVLGAGDVHNIRRYIFRPNFISYRNLEANYSKTCGVPIFFPTDCHP